ncbi:MAG: nitroreductase family protein [Bacteroidales bacterium]|jgi:NAD-dependent dihydropyrimidine dehydrogenase PreA subunit/nitroreductase|nr:nitroreductase family protein [Bacteroidales bacterium]
MKTVTISDHCIQCSLCVKACPAKVFTLEKKGETPLVNHPEMCIACGHCEAVCETDAVISQAFRAIGKTVPITHDGSSLLASLRSVRNYQKRALSQDALQEIIQAGYNAPTAQNLRVLSIENYSGDDLDTMMTVVNTHLEKLTKLGHPLLLGAVKLASPSKGKFMASSIKKLKRIVAEIKAGKYHFFHHAPHLIIIHAPKSNTLSKDDCDAALHYMRIAAHSKGYGTCIIGFAMTAAKSLEKHLSIPKENKIYGIITLGKPSFKYAKGIQRVNRK